MDCRFLLFLCKHRIFSLLFCAWTSGGELGWVLRFSLFYLYGSFIVLCCFWFFRFFHCFLIFAWAFSRKCPRTIPDISCEFRGNFPGSVPQHPIVCLRSKQSIIQRQLFRFLSLWTPDLVPVVCIHIGFLVKNCTS